MIEDRKGSYVITIAVNKKKKRIVTVNRFKLNQNQRYIFAKKRSRNRLYRRKFSEIRYWGNYDKLLSNLVKFNIKTARRAKKWK